MPFTVFVLIVVIAVFVVIAFPNKNESKGGSTEVKLKEYITVETLQSQSSEGKASPYNESQYSAPRLPLRKSFCGDTFPSEGNYTVIDTETTGLDACVCEILEIGAIQYRNNQAVSRFHSYVKPEGRIQKRASDINHITWAKVCNAPKFSEVYSDFIAFIGADILVGYNIGFDIKFIQTRAQEDINNPQFDVLQFVKKSLDLDSYKLSDLKQYFNISGSSHSAIDDCLTTVAVFQKCLSLPKTQEMLQKQKRIEAEFIARNQGYQYWAKGEEARIQGDFEAALNLFSLAQSVGYSTPNIYTSYAMIYRKQKDYESEISILSEALSKFNGPDANSFQYRKSRAESLLRDKQNRDMELKKKELEREQKAEMRQRKKELELSKPKKQVGRPVIQCSDDGTVIKKFSSISEAAADTGINKKSIRDAATGVQKHAGGYRWKFDNLDHATEIN